jgi:copper chaperone CopZ
MEKHVILKCTLLMIGAMGIANAEFRRIEIEVRDMDCASCVTSLRNSLKRMRGVESTDVAPERSSLILTLAAENKIALDRVRDMIKGAGFTPRMATVIVRGKAITDQGKWEFELEGVNQKYLLVASDEKLIGELQKGGVITIEATSPPLPDPRAQPSLQVKKLILP